MSTDANKVTGSWEGWSGGEVTREFNVVLDVRDYKGTPGYSLLVIAANPGASIMDLWNFLLNESSFLSIPASAWNRCAAIARTKSDS